MTKHDNRVALVTGANRGIGYAIAKGLAEGGMTTVLAVRNPGKGAAACSGLQSLGLDAYFELLDVTDEKSIRTAVTHIQDRFERLDILVNNAGILIDSDANVLDVSQDTVLRTLQTNVLGPLMLCQRCVPLMKAGGYGRIVNMASTLGSLTEMTDPQSGLAEFGSPAYRLSKAALNAVTTLVAKDVRDVNILVNSVCPGWVRTDMGGEQAPLTAEQGADTPLWLATLPDDGPSGGFFSERKQIPW
ncbi:MAG: SDR family oxidoreductase [Desulfobacterales bacterium]|jgi:NAD(P)-dependent dehydrogenase (short-subunit alcohol dehydrogenase family)